MRAKGFVVILWLVMISASLVMLPSFSAKAVAADEITVGTIGPMKFSYGVDIKRCTEMAAEEINAAGGVKVKGKSYKIVLTSVDDNGFLSIPDAISAMKRLTTVQNVKYVIGGMKTEAVSAQQEIMADNKVIYLGAGAGSDIQCELVAKDYNRYKYWFRVSPMPMRFVALEYAAQTVPVIRELNKIGIKKPKVAILADKAAWAEQGILGAQKFFLLLGCEVVGVWRPSFNATSYTAELSAIRSSGAHIIFAGIAAAPGNILSQQWGDLQIPAALAGVNNEGAKLSHWKTTNGKCNYMLTAVSGVWPKTRTFLAKYNRLYGDEPVFTGYGAYDALYVLKEAMERADSLDPDALVPALEKTNFKGTTGDVVFTPPSDKYPHDITWAVNSTAMAVQWLNGKQLCVWPDGNEIPEVLLAEGAPRGWDKVKMAYDSANYVLPPWVVKFWKDKK